MLIKQIMEVYDLLDDPNASGKALEKYLRSIKSDADIEVYPVVGEKGDTDFIKIHIPGIHGKKNSGNAPTIGIIGRLGGLGARPEITGYVSDGDGALVVLAVAAKMLQMQVRGDYLEGDVYIVTHICPDAPTKPHKPAPMMNSPVEALVLAKEEVEDGLDAVLSVDSTRANRIINHCGFAITPTVKEGFILQVSDDLLDIMQTTSGKLPHVMALSTADITPYENGLYHINSILQPSNMTKAPVVGVALTTQAMVAGCATGACHITDNEEAARFLVEVAKYYGRCECKFYDEYGFSELVRRYGSMTHLQTVGKV